MPVIKTKKSGKITHKHSKGGIVHRIVRTVVYLVSDEVCADEMIEVTGLSTMRAQLKRVQTPLRPQLQVTITTTTTVSKHHEVDHNGTSQSHFIQGTQVSVEEVHPVAVGRVLREHPLVRIARQRVSRASTQLTML